MLRRPILLTAALLFAATARPCGPDFPTAIFVLQTGPDSSYANYAAGHLGVLQSKYRTRHLVLAYQWLSQRPLSPAEQQNAITVDAHFNNSWYDEDQQKKHPAQPSGFDTWIAARASFSSVDGYVPDSTLETSLTANYNDTPNCLDDAFATAAHTLASRSKDHGSKDAAVVEWVRGQDAVFSNCGDGKAPAYYGPGKPPPPPPAPHSPAALPANAPLWLQQDRAYQAAAASFYAQRYDDALNGFRAIATDAASPWSMVSRYLTARVLIRKATFADDPATNSSGDAAKEAAAAAALHTTLGLARKELLAMQAEPRLAPMQSAIDDLLNYVNLRYDPDAQAVTLAKRLHTPGTPKFAQTLIDFNYLRAGPYDEAKTISDHTAAQDSTGMIAWINSFDKPDKALALQQWHSRHTTPWLLASMMLTDPGDSAIPELLHAAEAVQPGDPAWTAVTYHRLRLMPRNVAMRTDLLKVLPQITQSGSRSTINLFATLNASTAPTFESWLATAARHPSGEYSWGEETPGIAEDVKTDDKQTPQDSPEDVCGTKIVRGSTELFDADAANAFNTQLPLRLLTLAAESSTLPANLRFQVAQAAWARAVLLNRPEIAQRMSPLLINCRAAWKPVLAAYDAATSADDRKANGLLALMRFASTEPSVRYGEERRNGFATYDLFRQNWWCSTVPKAGTDVDSFAEHAPPDAREIPPPPPFLTPSDLAESKSEIAALRAIPNASSYFANQALSWMRTHPRDPRTPDILGQADRVLRNSCRVDASIDSKTGKPTGDPKDPALTANLAYALFEALHTNYPQSAWAKRYKTWQ